MEIPAEALKAATLAVAAASRPTLHGQRCPVWTRGAADEACDCWVLAEAHAHARIALTAALQVLAVAVVAPHTSAGRANPEGGG